jgi:TolB-like protein/Flp pilus assembly protein TadD
VVVERWRQIESLFLAAREKQVEERPRFLDTACAGDDTLRREVESLLANEEPASGFLESRSETVTNPAIREPVPRGERIGPYTVIELVGTGGMGEVYKAWDKRLERHVAIKFLPDNMATDMAALERFQREARAASALSHPNICTVYDVGESRGRPFIVMELLEGQSLRERIAGNPLPLPEFFTITRQVCAALEAAHAKGIVHRDVKPGNIFITYGGQVKILDFGLAKRGGELLSPSALTARSVETTRSITVTATGSIMGTLAYMSPEQAIGDNVDARSDLFSFGVVLYEMATGQPPFRGKTPAGMRGSIVTEMPAEPSARNGSIPAKLNRIILKALEKDRGLRYQSAALLSADLEEWQKSESAAADQRTRRWLLTAAGAGVASLAGGTFFARRALFRPERKIMVAILPFENVGGNPQQAFLADGLHQDMISVLNRLYPDRLGVIARTSVKRYQKADATVEQIGRELNVSYVVEGGVQRDGSQLHVTARLIRVKDQAPLWTATFDRSLDQILAVQGEVAQAIAQGIERGLRPDAEVWATLARPFNASAQEAYLRGDYAKAVQLDPSFAPAYSGLANQLYYPALFGFRPPQQAFSTMMNAASKALELDPTQASAHASMALGNLHMQRNWSEAEQGFQRALRLNPGDADTRHFFAHLLLWRGRDQESARQCEQAVELDPFDPSLFSCIGWHELLAGNRDKSMEETRRALALQNDHWWALMTLGWLYEQKRMFEEALAAFRKSMNSTLQRASIAHVFARSGNLSAAQTILDDLLAQSASKYVSPYDIAVIYAGLEDKGRTFEWLNKAYEEHAGFLLFVKQDPRFQPLRSDPPFQELLRRMGYSDRHA